jgi:GT2 family glycosyltransferase
MKSSVIVVSYHTGAVLLKSIESILKQQNLLELILVNNGNDESTNRQLVTIEKDYTCFKIISGQGNIGFGSGCNLGASTAVGEYLLFLNPDCIIPSNDALGKMMDEYLKSSKIILAGVKILNIDGTIQKTTIRNILTPKIAINEALGLNNFTPLNIDVSNIDKTIKVPAITGACIFISKDNFTKLSGFDESFFLHFEDMDLCYRASKFGDIIYIPHINITHYLSTSRVSSNFIEFHKAKSCIGYFTKHFSSYNIYILSLLIYARMIFKIMVNSLIRSRKH